MELAIGIGGLVAGFAAALFSLLAWLAARERQPFTLSEKRDGIAKLTRTRRPKVQVLHVWVHHRQPIISRDLAATMEFRVMERDQPVFLDLSAIPIGEMVLVKYRRFWPWDRMAPRRKMPYEEIEGYREKIGQDQGRWKLWAGAPM